MNNSFAGQRKIPRLMIPLVILRSRVFLDWVKTLDAAVWFYLTSYIIRDDVYTGKISIYNEFWENGILAARWSIENIAIHLGYSPNGGAIQKALKRLRNQGLIKTHTRRVGRSTINIYELGTHDSLGNDTLHALIIFNKIASEEKIREFTMPDSHAESKFTMPDRHA